MVAMPGLRHKGDGRSCQILWTLRLSGLLQPHPRLLAIRELDAGGLSKNLRRRHLDASQRAMVAARLANLPHGTNQWSRQLATPTQSNAAELLNVGKRSVERAREVLDEGIPELVEGWAGPFRSLRRLGVLSSIVVISLSL